MRNDLISGADAAASFLGLERREVYRLVENGHLPVVRKGRRLFFRKSELERSFTAARIALLNPIALVDNLISHAGEKQIFGAACQ